MQNGSWETQTTDGSVSVSFSVPSRSSDCLSFLQFSTIVLAASIILSINDDLSSVGALCYFVELQASHSIFKSLSSVAVRRTRRKILTHFKSFRRTLSHVS